MTRLACLLSCLLVALSLVIGAQGASAQGVVPVMQPLVNSQTSTVESARWTPSKTDDDWFLKKMLSPQQLRHLKLSSDLQGLADSTVSQPEGPV